MPHTLAPEATASTPYCAMKAVTTSLSSVAPVGRPVTRYGIPRTGIWWMWCPNVYRFADLKACTVALAFCASLLCALQGCAEKKNDRLSVSCSSVNGSTFVRSMPAFAVMEVITLVISMVKRSLSSEGDAPTAKTTIDH